MTTGSEMAELVLAWAQLADDASAEAWEQADTGGMCRVVSVEEHAAWVAMDEALRAPEADLRGIVIALGVRLAAAKARIAEARTSAWTPPEHCSDTGHLAGEDGDCVFCGAPAVAR